MKKIFIPLFCLFSLCENTVGQIPKSPVNVQTPNAASFNALGDYKVNSFVGSIGIDVGLCKITDGALDIPISLNYDARGVKPDVHPGWVGLNMNLAVGGSIVRTVHDKPDDYPLAYLGSPTLGYFSTRSELNNSNWSSNAGIRNVASLFNAQCDTEPDEFGFSMVGLSGKFYLGSDGNWKVQSEQSIKVEIIGNNSNTPTPFTPPSFTGNPYVSLGGYLRNVAGFILTDENGTKYEFGGGNNNYMEYSMNIFDQGKDTWTCNAWHLKTITTHTGQVINFTYERGDFIAQMYLSIYNKAYSVNGSGTLTPSCDGWSSLFTLNGPYGGKLISPIYLKEITSKNTKIEFISSESTELRYDESIFSPYVTNYTNNGGSKLDILTYFYDCYNPYNPVPSNPDLCDLGKTLPQLLTKLKWRKLDKIRITNTYDNVIAKEFEFTYNNVATERLMLQKVQEKAGTTSDVINPHEFTYNQDAIITIPNYLKSHTDHWGYNNGIAIVYPNHFNNFSTYGATYRVPSTNKNYYLLGTLNKIKYPTGGFTEFTFEPHTYSKEVKLLRSSGVDSYATTQGAGGLRLKKVRSYDPAISGSVIENKLYYLSGFNPLSPDTTLISSGVLGGKTQYYWNNYRPQTNDNNITYFEQVFSSQSVLPSSENSLGSHIGYSEIVERPSIGGWIVHKYSNFDNGYLDESFEGHLQAESTPYEYFNSKAFTRGKLLTTDNYFENGNPASKMNNFYVALGDEHARSVRTDVKNLCSTSNSVYEGTAYKIYTHKYKLLQEQSILYHQTIPSASVTSTTNYGYNAYGQVNEIRKSQSDGSELINRMKYIPEYKDTLQPTCLTNRNVCYASCPNCTTIEEVKEWQDQCDATYAQCINVPYEATADAILKMKSKHIWSVVEDLKYRNRYSTEQVIGGSLTISKEFTDNLVNNLLPLRVYKLHLANPISSNSVSFSYLNLSRDLSYDTRYKRFEMEFVGYNDEGNLLEMKDYGNVSTSYLWGYRNRLPIAEVKNATYATISSELTASTVNNLKNNIVSESVIRSTINQLRTGIDRKVTAYTHDPIYGVKSVTDPSNITNYFERDGIGRLKTIKDKDGFILKNYGYQYAGATSGGSGCTVAAPTITSAPASSGCSTVLTASACTGGTITWSNSLTGNSITVPSVSSPTYTATCTTTCTSPASNALAGLNLPSGWNPVETGTGLNGCTVLGSNQVKMSAAPSGGIGGTDPDTYYFMDKQYTGNVTMIAKISSMSTTANIRAGLIFRNSLTPKSPFFQIVQAGDDVVGKFYRNLENGDATIWKYGTGIPAGAWLRIKKVGNNVNSYYSTLSNPNINNDGDWTEILPNVLNPDPSIIWGTNFLIGMSLTNAIGSGIPSAQVIWSSVQVNNNGVLETPFN
jgi:hypothetical protein